VGPLSPRERQKGGDGEEREGAGEVGKSDRERKRENEGRRVSIDRGSERDEAA